MMSALNSKWMTTKHGPDKALVAIFDELVVGKTERLFLQTLRRVGALREENKSLQKQLDLAASKQKDNERTVLGQLKAQEKRSSALADLISKAEILLKGQG